MTDGAPASSSVDRSAADECDEGVERERIGGLASTGLARFFEECSFVRFECGHDLGGGVDGAADVDAAGAVGIGPPTHRSCRTDAVVLRGFVGARGGLHPGARGAEATHTVVRGAFEELGLRARIGGGGVGDGFDLGE